jgi:hypothetical protein
MSILVNKITFNYEADDEISHISCILNTGYNFDIEISEFYFWVCDRNIELNNYTKKFINWTEVTNDLISLSFDFLSHCQLYINSEFSENEINEFSY